MSNVHFPTLPGVAWDIARTPMFRTEVHQGTNGHEQRTAFWASPRWKWSLSYELLRDDASAELKTLMGFFLARQGAFDSFLYTDPNDGAVVGQVVGAGDGVNKDFQLVRTYGGFVEPVTEVDTLGLYKTDWQGKQLQYLTARTNDLLYSEQIDNGSVWGGFGTMTITANAAAAPDGTLTATLLDDTDLSNDRAYREQAITIPNDNASYTGSCFVSQGSAVQSVVRLYLIGGSTGIVTGSTITWGATPTVDFGKIESVGGGWYRVSFQITNNTTGNTALLLRIYPATSNASVVGSVYAWGAQVETGSAVTSYIKTTAAAGTVTDYGLFSTGLVSFASAPGSGAVISADMTYSWRVRFLEDQAEFSQFMSKLWELQKIELVSVK